MPPLPIPAFPSAAVVAPCRPVTSTARRTPFASPGNGILARAIDRLADTPPAGQDPVAMLDWLTRDGLAYAAANGYVPLPPQVQHLARSMLQQIAGPGVASLPS
jgi:hypothetical protein